MADLVSLLAVIGALAGGAMALGILLLDRRTATRWLFAAGMASLSLETLFGGFAHGAVEPQEVAYWENWSLVFMGLLPGLWLAFSLRYARGDSRKALVRWQLVLAVFFLIPFALVGFSHGDFVAAV